MALAYVFAFLTAICFGISALFEDAAAKSTPAANTSSAKSVLTVTTRLPFLAGMGLSLVGWTLSLLALQRLPLFAVQAILASSIGVVVLLDWVRTRKPIPRVQGILLVILGLGLVSLAVAAKPSGPGEIPRSLEIGIWITVGVLAVLWLALLRLGRGDRSAAILGAASGLAYGGTSLCARALETDSTVQGFVFHPLTIAILPFAGLGIATFAGALQRGSVAVATACQHATMTVVPSAIGLLVLDDRARSGFGLVAAAGFVFTIVAVVALTLVKPANAGDAVVPAIGKGGGPAASRPDDAVAVGPAK
jgi:glucose uptake protein GlcU